MFLYLVHSDDLHGFSDCLNAFFTMFAACLKIFNFMYKLGNILMLVKSLDKLIELSEYKNNLDHEEIKKRVGQGRLVYNIIVTSATVSCTIVGIFPIINWRDHKLSYRMYFPIINYKNNDLIFLALACYQMLAAVFAVLDMTLDMLPILFMCFAIGLIEELSERLENIGLNESIRLFGNPRMYEM